MIMILDVIVGVFEIAWMGTSSRIMWSSCLVNTREVCALQFKQNDS